MRANVSLLNEIGREGDLDQTTPQLAGGGGKGKQNSPASSCSLRSFGKRRIENRWLRLERGHCWFVLQEKRRALFLSPLKFSRRNRNRVRKTLHNYIIFSPENGHGSSTFTPALGRARLLLGPRLKSQAVQAQGSGSAAAAREEPATRFSVCDHDRTPRPALNR